MNHSVKLKQRFLLMLLMLCFSVSLFSQERLITVNLRNGTMKELFSAIEKQTTYRFSYRNALIDNKKDVTISKRNATVSAILDETFAGRNLEYSVISARSIVITSKASTAPKGDAKKISGTINDEKGEPVIGANVVVKGTTTGVITDFDGKFGLNAPEGATLIVSYIGHQPQVIFVDNKTMYDITLIEEAQSLDEVVVTALGIKRSEKALGYSVQKVDGAALQKVKGVNVATSLTGKVSGLLVKNSSDFGAAPALTIRGESPLLVIDGIAYANKNLSDIASEDIESLTVLKGATASALYGFRGASGAILITTKNGSDGNKGVTVEVSTNTMFTAGYLALPEKQSIYGRGSNNVYNRDSGNSWGPKMEGQMLNQWDPFGKVWKDSPYLPVGKDNFKNFLEQGYITNNNLNVSYSKDIVSLRSSLNWTGNNGQYPNQTLNKFSYAFGGDVNLDKFRLSSNLSYTKRMTPNMGSNGYTSYDPMYNLLVGSAADFNILDYKDNYWVIKDEVQNYTYRQSYNNPYFDAYEKTNEATRDIFNADISSSYDFGSWLKVTARSGLDFFLDRGVIRSSKGSNLSTGNTPIPGNEWTWLGGKDGAYAVGQTQGFSMNSDILFTGDQTYKDFQLEYLAGGTIFYQKNNTLYAATNGGLSIPGFYSLKASVNPANISESVWGRQVNSVYARLALSWRKMLFAEGTVRNDWSSTLASTDSKSYLYPSVAGSFVASELLPQTADWLDLLKARASWTMSKSPAAVYETNVTYGINSGLWNTANGASAPTFLFSSDVVPQAANTTEFGLQAVFFNNRLSADVSYYDKKMYDFLVRANISEASGYSQKLVNTKEIISRRGWEVSLKGTPYQSKDWKLDIGLNWSQFARYYTQLDDIYTAKRPWIAVGERVDHFISRNFQYEPRTNNKIWNNGRLLVSQYDSRFGYTDPDWLWGANATLRYKNFSLFVSLDGVVGGLTNTRTESYMWQTGAHPESASDARLVPYLGNGVKITSGTATYDAFGNITSDSRVFAKNDVNTTYQQYIIDLHGSSAWGGAGTPDDTYKKTFFKLREVSLTYDIPREYASKLKAKAASVSLTGQNVLLWAKDFKYSDPDGGSEDFADPAVRYIGGSIKLTF